jgi:DNA mismatch endonuclease, patch repair protein
MSGGQGIVGWSTPSPTRSRNMAAVKRSNTKPEVRLRSALHSGGYRFRKDFPIRVDRRVVRPDIVFTRFRVAVFVDGCFWHMCPLHGEIPATNVAFWTTKLEGNAARDLRQNESLTGAGWSVVRIWEHEPMESAMAQIESVLASRKDSDHV